MGHDWWIFATICAAIAAWLLLRLRRETREEARPAATFVAKREMTVLFTDLTGYVPLSEKLNDPKILSNLIDDHRAAMVPIIRKHRGVIGHFAGDRIMCFFGAPYTDPDHAAHAVAAARAMQQTHQQSREAANDHLRDRGLAGLDLRIGISTGELIVGYLGPPLNYTVIGEEVTRASRLETACKSTTANILISPRTAELVRYLYDLRKIPLPRDAGAGATAYEVLAPLPQDSRLAMVCV